MNKYYLTRRLISTNRKAKDPMRKQHSVLYTPLPLVISCCRFSTLSVSLTHFIGLRNSAPSPISSAKDTVSWFASSILFRPHSLLPTAPPSLPDTTHSHTHSTLSILCPLVFLQDSMLWTRVGHIWRAIVPHQIEKNTQFWYFETSMSFPFIRYHYLL